MQINCYLNACKRQCKGQIKVFRKFILNKKCFSNNHIFSFKKNRQKNVDTSKKCECRMIVFVRVETFQPLSIPDIYVNYTLSQAVMRKENHKYIVHLFGRVTSLLYRVEKGDSKQCEKTYKNEKLFFFFTSECIDELNLVKFNITIILYFRTLILK